MIFTAVNLIILIRMGNITDRLVSSCARSIVTFDIGLHEVCVWVGGRSLHHNQILLPMMLAARELPYKPGITVCMPTDFMLSLSRKKKT